MNIILKKKKKTNMDGLASPNPRNISIGGLFFFFFFLNLTLDNVFVICPKNAIITNLYTKLLAIKGGLNLVDQKTQSESTISLLKFDENEHLLQDCKSRMKIFIKFIVLTHKKNNNN